MAAIQHSPFTSCMHLRQQQQECFMVMDQMQPPHPPPPPPPPGHNSSSPPPPAPPSPVAEDNHDNSPKGSSPDVDLVVPPDVPPSKGGSAPSPLRERNTESAWSAEWSVEKLQDGISPQRISSFYNMNPSLLDDEDGEAPGFDMQLPMQQDHQFYLLPPSAVSAGTKTQPKPDVQPGPPARGSWNVNVVNPTSWDSDSFSSHEHQLAATTGAVVIKQEDGSVMEVDPGYYDSSFMPDQGSSQHMMNLAVAVATAGDLSMHQMPLPVVASSNNPTAATTRAARKSRMARKRRSMVRPQSTPAMSSSPFQWSSSSQLPPGQVSQASNAAAPASTDTDNATSMEGDKLQRKNLKFLLQKQLKPSDVGNLGRIVLPKKEAESRLPYLTVREGIILVMEDMTTARKWNLRYRFWPNNKSRMYLLENTGEFVKSHKLCEGDYLLLYKDSTNGNYVIYGKKVLSTGHQGGSSRHGTEKRDLPKQESSQSYSGDLKAKRAKSLDYERSSLKRMSSMTSPMTANSMIAANNHTSFLRKKVSSESDLLAAAGAAATTNMNKSINNNTNNNMSMDHLKQEEEEASFVLEGSASTFNVDELDQFPLLDSSELAIDEIMELVDLPAAATTTTTNSSSNKPGTGG